MTTPGASHRGSPHTERCASAGPFPQDFIESVRATGDLVRVVSDYVTLKPAGARLKGLCPFHEEKSPSFSVDPNKQLFYCFGCNTGGDVFKFVQLYEHVEFGESVAMLARRWGLELPQTTRRSGDDRHERLLSLNREAETFFRAALAAPAGERCRDYIAKRDIDEETVGRLGLGYAPDGWEALRTRLTGKKYRTEELLSAGLILSRKGGSGEYDRFRDRLMFPIRDVGGRTIAFGGRAIGDAEPKYINSPETPLYKKGDHLYGLDLARDAIRREGFAVVVEGYLDLAAVLRAGFGHVVASLGTAFTPSQARLLSRYCNRVVFSYDGDVAGSAATARSLDLLIERGFDVRVVDLDGGGDPDDFIRAHGSDAYGKRIAEAPGYIEFLIRRETRTRDLRRSSEKVDAVNAVLPHLSRLTDVVQRAEGASRLADALDIDDDLVLQQLKGAARARSTSIRRQPEGTRPIRQAEARMVSELLRSADERDRWCAELDPADLEQTEVRRIVETILTMTREGRPVDFPAVLGALEEEREIDLLNRIAFRDEPEEGPTVEDCLCALKRRRISREGKQVVRELGRITRSSTDASPEDVDSRLSHLQKLARQRDAL